MINAAFVAGDPSWVSYDRMVPWRRATVPGILLDADGSPAVVHGAEGRVHGWILAFEQAFHDEVLTTLDLHHGTSDGMIERTIAIAASDGFEPQAVHAWNWTGPLDLPRIESGQWPIPSPDLPL
jgi:hypothetical protein